MADHVLAGRIVDTTSFVSSLPHVEGLEISRDNILQTIETMIDTRDLRSLHIDGSAGIGKSVLLAQFARAHKTRVVSIFAKPEQLVHVRPWLLTPGLSRANVLARGARGTPVQRRDN